MGADETTTLSEGFASRGPVARVLLVFGRGEPQAIPLPEEDTLTIGRGTSADLRIEDPSLSRIHARLRFDLHATLEDLESSNGTFIGGIRLTAGRPVVIAPGATIRLGGVTAVLHFGASTPTVVGTSDGTVDGQRALEDVIARIAQTDLSVVFTGETGAGKSTFARRLHDSSRRSGGPFVVVGASSITRATIDSAAGGTLVVDEPAELDPGAVRLLIDALSAHVDPPRLVSTSTRDLEREVDAGRFSRELYHRLAGVSVVVPPLRRRVHEISLLAQSIASAGAKERGRAAPIFSPDALALLERHPWPGNVRELAQHITKAIALSGSRVLTATHFGELQSTRPSDDAVVRVDGSRGPLREARERNEYQQIIEALRTTRGNQTRAAALLGISRSTLLDRLGKYGLPRPRKT